MKKEELRLIFMGTADFAVPALRALVENGYQVKAVVTMPDKPMGRGHKVSRTGIGSAYSPAGQSERGIFSR